MNHDFEKAVLQVVVAIPYGQVMTYGQVGIEAGYPRHARHVGHFLAGLRQETAIPWYRVVGAGGEIKTYSRGIGDLQAQLLISEGIGVQHGKLNLKAHQVLGVDFKLLE